MDLDGLHIFTREEMDRLVRMLNMPPSDRYITFSEAEMNRLSACCRAFDEYEQEILALTGASLTELLLSKYYWRGRLELLAGKCLGANGDFAQYTFKALEELGNRLEDIDWSLVERLDEEIERGHSLEG